MLRPLVFLAAMLHGSSLAQKAPCSGAVAARSAENINEQCCGSDDAACSSGVPTSCDAGCASVFLPFVRDCPEEALPFASVVAVCEANPNEKPNSCLAAVYELCGPMGMASAAACSRCAGLHQAAVQAAGCTPAKITTACSISTQQVPISGLRCDGDQTVWVLTPGDGQKHPLVSFAHGYTA